MVDRLSHFLRSPTTLNTPPCNTRYFDVADADWGFLPPNQIQDRMKKLETWLLKFTQKFNCQDLQNEACVDEFFEIFFRVVQ